MSFRVYLGDTSSDLLDLRPLLIDQIQHAGMAVVALEDGERRSSDLLAAARARMQSADFFITLVTFKRAWEPAEMGGRSLAEIEFDLAHELAKPAAVLLPKPSGPLAASLRQRAMMLDDASDRHAQRAFRLKIKQSGPLYFADEADLSAQLMRVLKHWAASKALPSETQASPVNGDVETLAERVAERTVARLQEIQFHDHQTMARRAVEYTNALRLQPGELVFGRPSTSSQFRSDVFVIMPFSSDFHAVYHQAIRTLADELNLNILRGDDFSSSRGSIISEVWAAINACRLVIADITGGNDNVYYELGMAHTLNKPSILITQPISPDAVPFDIRHLRYIQYENTPPGIDRLRSDLGAAVSRLLTDLSEGWGRDHEEDML